LPRAGKDRNLADGSAGRSDELGRSQEGCTMPRMQVGSIHLNVNDVGSGDPLLLIMGFGMSGDMWVQSLPHLNSFRTIYFDNRGTGGSDSPPGPHTIEQMADDAVGVLDACGIERAHVYGISMGGMIAQEVALRHPNRVRRLVLGCTMPGGTNAHVAPPEIIEQLVTAVQVQASDPERSVELSLPLLFPRSFIDAQPMLKPMMVAAMSMMKPTPPETATNALEGIMAWSAYERLHAISAPTLVLHGTDDVLIPAGNADLLANRIPNARKVLFDGEGHGYGASDPVGVHRHIVEFLTEA
jgi:pimeloyl-ACP methyl ester carboxylesterase